MCRIVFSRRKFICKSATDAAVFLLGIYASCVQKKAGSEDRSDSVLLHPCDDLDGLSEKEIDIRRKLGYVKESPIPDNQCKNCNLYLPPANDKKCDGCMLFKGPVHQTGYCTYWVPRA